MSRKSDDDQEEEHEAPERPQPYPVDSALEEAFAPEPPVIPAPPATPQGSSDSHGDSNASANGAPNDDWLTTITASEPSSATAASDGDRQGQCDQQAPQGQTPQRGQRQPHEQPERQQQAQALVSEQAPSALLLDSASRAPNPSLDVPETLGERLSTLRPWQAQFVLSLMECGGNIGLACQRTSRSRRSVQQSMKDSPDFAAACAEALEHSTDLIEGATFRAATVGDLRAKYQGGLLMCYERIRSDKAAEIMLELRGRLRRQDSSGPAGKPIKVEVAIRHEVPELARAAAARLFAARDALDGLITVSPSA